MLCKVSVEFREDYIKVDGLYVSIGIKSTPLRGQANKELIKRLAKYFGISSTRISIKKGLKSKEKVIEISN